MKQRSAVLGPLLLLSSATSPAIVATAALHLFGSDKEDPSLTSDALPADAADAAAAARPVNSLGQPSYGVDVSFPIHRTSLSTNYAWLPHNVDPAHHATPPEFLHVPVNYLGDTQSAYDAFLSGCEEKYGVSHGYSTCRQTEEDRVEMSLRQPASMQNYTSLGFKKIRAPEEVWQQIKTFWEANKDRKNWQVENWPKGNTYTNHWKAPTYMVSVEDTRLRGAGSRLKQSVWNAARETIQEWTGEQLTECSMYGIRVYTEGSILATHVDRMPLVSSAILNVDQDVDEPWPIEVYGHDGLAYNVTMEPGDMVLYESHSVLHGRPFPLKGRYYANIFIHFEPTGHSLRHNAKEAAMEAAKGRQDDSKFGGHENEELNDGLPSYIVRGSVEEERWHRSHPDNNNHRSRQNSFTTGSTPAHRAAQEGDVEQLTSVIDRLSHLLDAKDANGWTPLHEGARAGHVEVVKLLIEKGASVNERTMEGKGETPLYWSIKENGEDHPVSQLLMSFGGLSIGPDL